MSKKQKLELTWVGKEQQPQLEPRILIEDPEKSYGESNTENMLIHGDNLLALKALESDFAGKIKCVYIDPPYNTGNAFDHYDDGLEHSIWLSLIKPRLELIHRLLRDDGTLWISIDDDECHYLKVLCDEVFGRNNFVTSVAVKMSTASGVKTSHREKTIIKEKEYVLVYSKEKANIQFKPQYIPKIEWDKEFQYYLDKKDDEDANKWEVKRLSDILATKNIKNDPNDVNFQNFVVKNADKIWRRAFIRNKFKELSQNNPSQIIFNIDENNNPHYYYRGREMYFYKSKFNICFTEEGYNELPSHLLGDFWTDVNTGKLFNEGNIDFRNGKKPEFLIARIIELCTNPNDMVLDSFLGSGTTAAVANKMNRKWISVELGEHCNTHCIPRLKQVVDGTDQGGISKAVNWKGGGGFKFYNLAPSILKKDNYDNWVIEETYNADMLAAAMAKHEGYKYNPSNTVYWKQGQSSEKDFIYTTTQPMTADKIDQIKEALNDDETLVICCRSFHQSCKTRYTNITVKKIPQLILGKCEFGKEDYSLNIINLPMFEEEEIEEIRDDISSNDTESSEKQLGLFKQEL